MSSPPGAPGSCHSPGGGRARGRARLAARRGPPGTALAGQPERCGRAGRRPCRAAAHALGEDAAGRRAHSPHVQARASRKRPRDKDFWRAVREQHRVVTAGVAMVTGGPDVATLGCDGVLAGRPKTVECVAVTRRRCFSTWGEDLGKRVGAPRGEQSLRVGRTASQTLRGRGRPRSHHLPEVAWRKPRAPGPPPTRKRKQAQCAPSSLPSRSCCSHCRRSHDAQTQEAESAAAAAAATTPCTVRPGRAWRRGGRESHW